MSVDSQNNVVDDIEDLISKDDDLYYQEGRPTRSRNKVKLRSRQHKGEETDEKEVAVGDSIIPGTQSIYLRTWGCSHNKSDGEYMAGQLNSYGYKITGKLRSYSIAIVGGYVDLKLTV